MSCEKNEFIAITPKNNEFYFGSNVYGYHSKTGLVSYNSHNAEEFYFECIEDFASFYFDNNKTVPYGYRYYCGEWDDEDSITLEEGITKEEADLEGDTTIIWSKLISKNGFNENILILEESDLIIDVEYQSVWDDSVNVESNAKLSLSTGAIEIEDSGLGDGELNELNSLTREEIYYKDKSFIIELDDGFIDDDSLLSIRKHHFKKDISCQ